jgi:hypothetical protein
MMGDIRAMKQRLADKQAELAGLKAQVPIETPDTPECVSQEAKLRALTERLSALEASIKRGR